MRHRESHPAAHGLVVALVLALGAMVAGCQSPTQSAQPTTPPAPTTTPSGPVPAVAIRAYFGLGSTAGNPILAPVERPAPAGDATTNALARAAIEALVAGPKEPELSATPAMFTAIPDATELAGGVQIQAGVATVDLSTGFEETDELPALRTALAQVVFTLTQFPEITGVNVTIAGAVLTQTDADGRDLEGPATRADYEDQMGPLFVDAPAWGATLTPPMQLSGLADVFEAQFRFRLLDADGRSLADGQLTASCGTGCLGTYSASVPFNVNTATSGRLQVFDLSEQDGSMQDVVDYPVTLQP